MKDFLKKYKWWIVFGILAVLGDIRVGGLFYVVIFAYILFIKFLLSDSLKGKHRKIASTSILILFIVYLGLAFYVHRMPHGAMFDTGYENDNGVEIYKEDMRSLGIPDWAKFMRTYNLEIFFALFFALIVFGSKEENNI